MANGAQEGATRARDRSIPNAVGSVPQRPKRAHQVELLGELDSAAFQDQQWLVIRDSRFIQISELLYRILDCSDGVHTLDAIAADVGPAIDRVVSRENVEQLI